MFRPRTLAATLAVALLGAVSPAVAQSQGSASQDRQINGVWRNPKNSVHIDIRPCGDNVCGYVVWASAKAQEDARDGGSPKLVGMQLLRNFSQDRNGVWRGRVFVPDLNSTFSGSAELVNDNTLRARGCLIAGLGCKTQTWTRVDGRPS